MSNQSKLLLFHIDPVKRRQIENLCHSLHITALSVKRTSYSQTLGYLAGISGFARQNISYNGPEFPSEMLVFCGMDSETIDTFLAAYKKASIPPIGLKAILTQHNIFWSAETLYKELFKEHTSLH